MLEQIRAAKQGERPRIVSIVDEDAGVVIGRAEVLGVQHIDDALVERLVRWRNRHRFGWLDQRTVTVETTRAWLEKYLRAPDMMVYLLFAGDKLIGRTGLLELTAESFLTDGMVRGEPGGGPRFFYWMGKSLLAADRELTGVTSVVSKILEDNELALDSSTRLGYVTERSVPMYRREDVRGTWLSEQPGPDATQHPARLLYRRLRLT